MEIETVVSFDTRPQNDLIIKTSREVEEQLQVISLNNIPHTQQSCKYWKPNIHGHIIDVIATYKMILIPTKRLRNARNFLYYSYSKCVISTNDETLQDYGPLRNEYSQAYLSVQDDSNKEGASIVMDREWRNSPGQNWKFVNGQLRNGFGKCFTKWSYTFPIAFTSIYQYDCNHNWEGQKWYRYGLQIANVNVDKFICVFYGGINVPNYPYLKLPGV